MNRQHHYKRQFKISLEQYEHMLASQKGACALCKRSPLKKDGLPKWGQRRLAVDHDHYRKLPEAVRGLLCNSCNRLIIGLLESLHIRLDDLILYLRGRSVACDPENTPLEHRLHMEP